MGRKIVLTGTTLTDTTAPRLATIDAIESDGSLLLIDPSHPMEQWAAGVPATGTALPNLFAANLAALGAAGGGDALIRITGAIDNGTKGKVERSTKGGLHVIVSQASALTMSSTTGDGVTIKIPEAVAAYINANPTHSYYMSAWDRLTRAQTANTYQYAFVRVTTNEGLGNMSGTATQAWPSTATALGGDVLGNTAGGRFGYHAQTPAGAMYYASGGSSSTFGPMWGSGYYSINAVNAGFNNTWPSFVFYRLYCEDLTVSGRTHAEVAAIDQTLYTTHVLTPGGRYYGDTFTDPATIP